MKILKLYPFPDVKAGTEISMHLAAGALKDLGHQVFLLHGMPERPETAALYQESLGLPPLFDRRSKLSPKHFGDALQQAKAFCQKHQIDVIHIHTYPRTSVIRYLNDLLPTVVSIHVPLCPNGARYLWADRQVCTRKVGLSCLTVGYRSNGCGHLGNGLPIPLPGFVRAMAEDHLLREALRKCSCMIANSSWMKESLLADSFSGENISIVHEPIVVGENIGECLPEYPPIIAFIGRLVDFKGADHLLRASAKISSPHRLWFIGDGAMRTELEELKQKLSLTKRTTFFGSLPPEEIAQYRRQSAIIVVPSLWPEPFGMVGPEAMLMQRPVVAYRVGGIPEWLQDNVTGRLVEPGNVDGLANALQDLLNNPEKAHDMGQNGAKHANNWIPEKHAVQLEKVYQNALSNNGHRNLTL